MASPTPEVIWQPPPELAGKMPMDVYRRHINRNFSQSLSTTRELQAWTVANQQPFWIDLYTYLGLIPSLPAGMTQAYDDSLPMSSIPPWFEGVQLNYAENVLQNAERVPENVALIGLREGQDLDGEVEKVTWAALRERVGKVSAALRTRGIRKGDVVAAIVSNSIDAVVLFLSTAAVAAVFTSISPDLGAEVCTESILVKSRYYRLPYLISIDTQVSAGLHRKTPTSDTQDPLRGLRRNIQRPTDTFIVQDQSHPRKARPQARHLHHPRFRTRPPWPKDLSDNARLPLTPLATTIKLRQPHRLHPRPVQLPSRHLLLERHDRSAEVHRAPARPDPQPAEDLDAA